MNASMSAVGTRDASAGLHAPDELLKRSEPASRTTGPHAHARGQLFALRSGMLVIETPTGRWVLPPGWIGWIPPRHAHGARSEGATEGWSLYLDPSHCSALPAAPQVFAPYPLVQSLVDRLASLPAVHRSTPDVGLQARRGRLIAVLVDELAAIDRSPMQLPMPRDVRLLRMATALVADPSENSTLVQWAVRIGVSHRTLTRRFASETGLTFARWRQQARMLKAVELLGRGESVTATALSVGYASVSAFIETFAAQFGSTPARFVSSSALAFASASNPASPSNHDVGAP